jgi:hypothetical protein
MVKTAIYYLYMEDKMSLKSVRNIAIAADAVCWGALVFFGVHFFTCGG